MSVLEVILSKLCHTHMDKGLNEMLMFDVKLFMFHFFFALFSVQKIYKSNTIIEFLNVCFQNFVLLILILIIKYLRTFCWNLKYDFTVFAVSINDLCRICHFYLL